MARKGSGRGLLGVFDCHRQECSKMADYLDTAEDPLVAIVKDSETRRVHGIMSYVAVSTTSATTEEINEEHKIEVLKMTPGSRYTTVS